MNLDLDQICTRRFPFYSLTIKDNRVISCVHDGAIICWMSECIFKKVCIFEKGKLKGGDNL